MRVIGYARVSSEEEAKSGAGLAAHSEAIANEIARQGWVEVDFIEDAWYSAKNLRDQAYGWRSAGSREATPLTPSGEAMAGVMAVFAQLERRLIGERTKAALAQRKAAGVRLGRPRVIPPDVDARVCELRAHGLSIRCIARTLESEGHTPPSGGDSQVV